MEFLSGLFVGYLLNWYAIGILLSLGILLEFWEINTLSVVVGLLLGVVSYKFFNLSPQDILGWVTVYLCIGITWSFWRYKRFLATTMTKVKYVQDSLLPTQQTSRIVSWILVWPFSLVENLTSDIVTTIKLLVTNFLSSVYQNIYNSELSKHTKEEQ